jgi:hypothetical protein
MSPETEQHGLIDRREAIRRVSALLGGVALVGGSSLLTACERERPPAPAAGASVGQFTAEDVAFLDEVAETILPETRTPGAKAAATGAFMALMVTDTYDARQQQIFRDGMRALDAASVRANGTAFMSATPQQRLALLETLDREQKAHTDAREAARKAPRAGTADSTPARDTTAAAKQADARQADTRLPDQRQENAPSPDVGGAAAITADAPPHYFRMMKELALLGYFTSEIGYTKAMRYVESPGRFDPCAPYTPGEPSWAPHA